MLNDRQNIKIYRDEMADAAEQNEQVEDRMVKFYLFYAV